MFCPNCGHDRDENNKFCTNCGFRFEDPAPEGPVRGTGFAAKVTEILKSDLFLVMCILYTGAAVFSAAGGAINVFATLFSVFFWILFSAARSKNTSDVKNLRAVSGTVFAQRVVFWVLFGMMVFCSVIFFIGSAFVDGTEIAAELNEATNGMITFDFSEGITDGTVIFILCGVFALIVAAGILVINLLVFKNIHRFTKSLYPSVATDCDAVAGANAARIALLVIGIITAVSAVFGMGEGFVSIACGSCYAAGRIVASVIIKQNFCKTENQL